MVLSNTAQGVMDGEENEQIGLEKIGSVLMLRKGMAERMMRFFGHIVRKNGMETN